MYTTHGLGKFEKKKKQEKSTKIAHWFCDSISKIRKKSKFTIETKRKNQIFLHHENLTRNVYAIFMVTCGGVIFSWLIFSGLIALFDFEIISNNLVWILGVHWEQLHYHIWLLYHFDSRLRQSKRRIIKMMMMFVMTILWRISIKMQWITFLHFLHR